MLISEIQISREYCRQERLSEFVNFFKRHNIFWGVQYYFNNKSHITPAEMVEVFAHFQPVIKEYVQNIMINNHYEPAFRTLCKLHKAGLNWDWVTNTLDANKADFIKMMLELIKAGNYNDAKEIVDDAIASPINWPEIQIIKRSINTLSTKRAIAENAKDNLTQEQRDMLVQIVTDSIKKKNIIIGLYDISQWGITVKMLPELADILNEYKTKLISTMLKNIKQGVEGLHSVEQTLSRLEGTGIQWPELAVIRKSLNTEFRREYDDNVEMLTPIDESYSQTKMAGSHLVGMLKDAEELQAMSSTHFWMQVEVDLIKASRSVNIYDVSSEIEPHKKDILRWILTRVKEATDDAVDPDDKVPMSDMLDVMRGLRNFGVKWPELNAIEQSLNYEIDR